MTTLHIQLLGDFRLTLGSRWVTTVVQARMQSLLAYLMLHGETPQPRQRVAFLFWPETPEPQARTNLRQLLFHIRRDLPESDQFLQIETRTLQWRQDAPYSLDVADFRRDLDQAAVAAKQGHAAAERIALESAIQRYDGDLLAGLYDDWILPERERLSQDYIKALERLILLVEEQREYGLAVRYAEQLLRYDPLNETTYRHLMRLHAIEGDRASALRIYHSCVATLADELGVEPNVHTQEAYQHLMNVKERVDLRLPSTSMHATGSSFVGRHREWNILRKAWRRAASGRTELVVVFGEAGIGKTRLAEEFLEWADQQGIETARTRCYAAEGQLAYVPLIELLRTKHLFRNIARLGDIWRIEVARLVPELIGEQPDRLEPQPIEDSWQRLKLFEALARGVIGDKRPLLLLFDDLQWCDQDTLEWIHYLTRFDPGSRLLVLGVVRPEEVDQRHPLSSLLLDLRRREQVIEVELGPLEIGDATVLAEQTAGRKIDTTQAVRLYSYTEGNPLFVIETIRAGLNGSKADRPDEPVKPDANHLPFSSTKMPTKVQAIVQARLRQLSPQACDLVRHAAAIGREFTFDMLSQATKSDEETLVRGLDELWWRRVIRELGGNTYYFSHDRIREVAYDEISPARRKLLHRRTALALERVYANALDTVSGQIAVHYEQAGEPASAITYYHRAARVAQHTFSNAEVIDLTSRALDLLPSLPDTHERKRTELSLLITLGTAQMLTMGYGHPQAEQTFLRAWHLRETEGNEDQPIPVMAGLWLCYHLRGDQVRAMGWAKQLEHEARRTEDRRLHVIAQFALAGVSLVTGDFNSVHQHAEQGFGWSDPQQIRSQSLKLGYEPGVWAFGHWSQGLWFLGYPDQARMKVQEMVKAAYMFRHPISIGYALSMSTVMHQLCGDVGLTLEQAAETVDYATEKGLPQWIGHGRILTGWALAHAGQPDRGYEQIRQGIATWKAAGAGLGLTYYLALLAESCTISAHLDPGLEAVAEGLVIVNAGGESVVEAELYRCQGELLLMQGADEQDVEARFQRALEIARLRQARSTELRVAMSLSRLWQRCGKQTEGRGLLRKIYGWFTEGFDTADLRQARDLLDSFI